MAIGTDVKIGWDATEVKRGFSSLRGMFHASFRGLRQIGIGAARQIGAGVTDLMGRFVMAIPEGMKEMLDWAGNLTDMSAQTGVSISKIVLLEEALRLCGGSAADTSRMLSVFSSNLYEATQEAGPARDALHKLGLRASDIKGMKLDQQFETIGKAIANTTWETGELESVMESLFGAKMGYKLIRFFKDYNGSMKQAENNVGDFARRLDKSAAGYDQMSDALGRFKNRWRELLAVIMEQVTNVFGTDFVDKAFDWLNPDKIRQTINWARENIIGFFKDGGFTKLFQDLGHSIGDGIKDSIRDLIPKINLNPFASITQPQQGGDSMALGRKLDQLIADQRNGNRSLMKIENLNMAWA